jgi:large subunit ribosomal protein L21
MSYAIVRASGKQHRVKPGERLTIDRMQAEVGEEFILGDVLLLAEGEAVRIGQPTVDGAQVTARVLSHDRGDKIRVFKRKKRKGFHKTIGHRQALTDIEIVKIGG